MGKFTRSATRTFIAATMGSVVQEAIINGISDSPRVLDFSDCVFNGLETGISFISNDVAQQFIKKMYPQYGRKLRSNETGDMIMRYVIGGIGGSTVAALARIPVNYARNSHKGRVYKYTPEMFVSDVVDGAGGSIGFLAASDLVEPMLPKNNTPLGKWFSNQIANSVLLLGAKLGSFPIEHYRYGVPFSQCVRGFTGGLLPGSILGDTYQHFSNLLGFIEHK